MLVWRGLELVHVNKSRLLESVIVPCFCRGQTHPHLRDILQYFNLWLSYFCVHLPCHIWQHPCYWIFPNVYIKIIFRGALHCGHWSRGQRIPAIWLVESKVCPLGLHMRGHQPKDNALLNVYIATIFVSFGSKNLFGRRKFVYNINRNPNSPREDNCFFSNLYKLYNLHILMDFYFILARKVCLSPF
jgi:hypothetical protein